MIEKYLQVHLKREEVEKEGIIDDIQILDDKNIKSSINPVQIQKMNSIGDSNQNICIYFDDYDDNTNQTDLVKKRNRHKSIQNSCINVHNLIMAQDDTKIFNKNTIQTANYSISQKMSPKLDSEI